jgi:NAD(P)-dependent dehydrogenase (short-subunit alcohol dehydrogenase family)
VVRRSGQGFARPTPVVIESPAMDLRLDGKVALVTGGSKGIGKGIAKAFVDAGADVMITARKADGPSSAAWRVAHVGSEDDANACIAATLERFGRLDILVNNAATNPHAGRVIDAPLSKWDKTHEVNLRGPLMWTQIAWRSWMEEHGGCVINIASVGAFRTSAALGVYSILKAALVQMTRQLGAELGPGVRVNAIAPSVIRTDFARILWEGDRGAQTAKAYPLKRLGEPADVGEAALYLAAGASWMTGNTLILDGGAIVSVESGASDE